MLKQITSLVLAAAVAMSCVGCGAVDKLKETLGSTVSELESENAELLEKTDPTQLEKDEAQDIFELLKAKDTAKLNALFSKKIAARYDLDKLWADFYDQIDGEIVSFEYLTFPTERLYIDKNGVILDSSLSVTFNGVSTSTGKQYELGYYHQRKYPEAPDNEGIQVFNSNIRDERNILIEQYTVGDVIA